MAKRKLEAIEGACRAKGLRVTGPRRVIAQILSEADDHPDVNELHRRAALRDERISLATVYRTVKMFEDIGVIERHAFNDGRARYERTPTEHHDHLIDVQSGEVIEFHSKEIETLQAQIAARLGYRIVGHRLELYVERVAKPAG
ncbi:MAG: transcriptional repressor [Rhizobiales bacterium]|nr:transcriptional repressor [Hyphomicrobiales bacterium]